MLCHSGYFLYDIIFGTINLILNYNKLRERLSANKIKLLINNLIKRVRNIRHIPIFREASFFTRLEIILFSFYIINNDMQLTQAKKKTKKNRSNQFIAIIDFFRLLLTLNL